MREVFNVTITNDPYPEDFVKEYSEKIRHYVLIRNGILLCSLKMVFGPHGSIVDPIFYRNNKIDFKMRMLWDVADVCTIMSRDYWRTSLHYVKQFKQDSQFVQCNIVTGDIKTTIKELLS